MDNKSLLPRILLYLSHLHLFHRELSFFHQLTLMQLEIVLFEIHLPSSTCYEQHLISNKSLLQRKLRTFHHSLKSFYILISLQAMYLTYQIYTPVSTEYYRIVSNKFCHSGNIAEKSSAFHWHVTLLENVKILLK